MNDRVTHSRRRWAGSRVTAILMVAAACALLFSGCAQLNKKVCCAAAQTTMEFETTEVTQEDPKGHLVIEGGGGTVEIRKRTLELAGGGKAKVLVIPQASSEKDIGRVVAEGWKKLGAGDVAILDLSDPEKAVAAVMNADLVWMSGGETMRLINALKKTGLPEAIRRRYREGAVIGGTSAGATVMSKFMLSNSRIYEGLGLWPEAIVDQHFLAPYRFNRLLEAVLDSPELIGVGIDERTAVFVHGKSFEVVGDNKVLVLDARKAKIENGVATDVVLHVLQWRRLMPSVFGKWEFTTETRIGGLTRVLTLKEDMTGTYQMRGREVPIKELEIEEQEITFKLEMTFQERPFTVDFRGKVEGDIINGEFTMPVGKRDVKGKWIGTETAGITAEEAIDRLDKMIETAKQTGTVENIDEAVATIEAAGENMETADLLEKLDVLQEHRKDGLLPKPEKALSSNRKLDWAILNKNVCCAAAQTMDFETSEVTQEDAKGHLVIDGGSEIRKRTLDLAGGGKAKVLVIPQASPEKDRGQEVAGDWKRLGAGDVAILDLSDPEKAVAAVMNADLIWMSGGDTGLLINALNKTRVPEALRRRYHEGAVIGGTSAGATPMSKFMLRRGMIYEGLGLWPEAIVDQHFLERYRFNRLLEAVLDRPELLGFGIDEQTAVFIHGKSFEVVGDNNVLVLDARKAKIENGVATDVVLHVLRQGRLTIEITGPVKDCFDPGESVLLEAKATVYKDSKVRRVEFIADGKTIASDTDAPYVFNWATAEEGRHTIKAKICDNKGRTEESLPFTIFVGMRALERVIIHSFNDAEEYAGRADGLADGSMDIDSSDLDLINDGRRGARVVGMRFTDIPIPQGVQIRKAYLQFTVDKVKTKPTNLVIHAEATPSYPKRFLSVMHNISSRKRTKASVKWSPERWDVIGERSEKQRTPDLSALIQEVIAQSDWYEGNALVFIITGSGERCAVSYDGKPGGAPVLYTEY